MKYSESNASSLNDAFSKGIFSRPAVFPTEGWIERSPEEVGVDSEKLKKISSIVGANGLVIRVGYLIHKWGDPSKSGMIASAGKTVISSLLMVAIQKGLIESPDSLVSDFEPQLLTVAGGKNSKMTWRHLASMISGYGCPDLPGEKWSYNDFAISLYIRTLFNAVFGEEKMETPIKSYLMNPVGAEDPISTIETGERYIGIMYMSARDLARFGLLVMNGGNWNGEQIIRQDLVETMLTSPVSKHIERSSYETESAEFMIKDAQTYGGGLNQGYDGPGIYSFNWWVNGEKADGEKKWPSLPDYAYQANGRYLMTCLWLIPEYRMVFAWNEAYMFERFKESRANEVANLISESIIE